MRFRVFAQFVGIDWDGNEADWTGMGWTDHEIIVHSNSRKNAAKKVWKWAKLRGARQKNLLFVDDEIWKRDKSYNTRIIK
jgi:hypothetical protein